MTLRVNPDAAIRSMAGELRGRPVLLAENVRLPFTPPRFPAKVIPDEGTVTLMLITTKASVDDLELECRDGFLGRASFSASRECELGN